ncbi:MAG TPA: class I SAM-dependent methyltransferase [Bryobacteraceae bacterium]
MSPWLDSPASSLMSSPGASIPKPDLSGWFTDVEAEVYRSLVSAIRSGTIVEVGVWKGRSLSAILDVCRANQNRLYAVDTWRPDLRDAGYQEAAVHDIGNVFLQNLCLLGHRATVEIIREDSARACDHFPDRSVDLVFLDADHSYESVRKDLLAWFPKVAKNGVLCGHDYTTRIGVRRAVDEMFGACAALPGGSIWVVWKRAIGRPKLYRENS